MSPRPESSELSPSDRPMTVGGMDAFVVRWVARELGMDPETYRPGSGLAIMLDGLLIGGVAFHGYVRHKNGSSIQASIATRSPRWATRRVLREMFAYPFNQLGVTRLWVMASRKDKRARKLQERLGFKFEGIARAAWDGKVDAAVSSMLPNECRWLKETGVGR